MKKYILKMFLVTAAAASLTGCLKGIDPMTSYVTEDQAKTAPGAIDNFVLGLTSGLCGEFIYGGNSNAGNANDFGYPACYIMRDITGQDMVGAATTGYEWFGTWYKCDTGLAPTAGNCQMPITYYGGWLKNCNIVLDLIGEEISEQNKVNAGIAYAMRALLHEDMARMYCVKSYAVDKNALAAVIQVTQPWNQYYVADYTHNPRVTNEVMWQFILSDLDKAEELLADYTRSDKYTPDLSVVYGLKARAYLEMCDWENAERYAKLAQSGYSIMTDDEYTSRETGFNTPNDSWMLGLTFKDNDPNIILNDSDSNWGSQMILEIDPVASACGYAANYLGPKRIDYHLYSTIPATDCRKKCFVDFAIDDITDKNDAIEALRAYTDYPDWIYDLGVDGSDFGTVGGMPLKFRAKGGVEGRTNQYIGFCVAVPMMRVEEMYLIEAEAVGMQTGKESQGQALLTTFATKRDASYTYGSHNSAKESYNLDGNSIATSFQDEVWWQRRVEFWGEGLSMYDIKRLGKSIIRSYDKTNHWDNYQWNTQGVPQWMTFCYGQTESNYNYSLVPNAIPVAPEGNSTPYSFD